MRCRIAGAVVGTTLTLVGSAAVADAAPVRSGTASVHRPASRTDVRGTVRPEGGNLRLVATGYDANEPVVVRLAGSTRPLARTRADRAGLVTVLLKRSVVRCATVLVQGLDDGGPATPGAGNVSARVSPFSIVHPTC